MARLAIRTLPWGLLFAVAVYVVLRGLILHSAFDETALPMYELYPMGTLPKVLLEGADFPLRIYYDNAAGQLVTGLATVPYYVALGQTYLALKLVPATFGLGALILVYVFLRQSFGRRAANLGALLFALGPATTLTKYSLMASGNHFENLFFTMLALVCFYRLQQSEHRTRWLWLAGLTGGLALFVFLGAIIPVGLLALTQLGLRGWRGFLRDLRVLLPAFALGLAPLLVLNLATGGRGMGFLQAKFGAGQKREQGVLERMGEFLFREMPHAAFFDSFLGLPKAVANWAFVICFAVAWLGALPAALSGIARLVGGTFAPAPEPAAERARFERVKLVPLVAYLPLTALAYGLSDLKLANHIPPMECAGYRYYLLTLLFAILLIAILYEGTRDSLGRGARRLGTLTAVVALLTGLWNLSYVDFSFATPGLGAHYRGYNFVQAARGLTNPKNGLTDAQVVHYADELAPVLRHRMYFGIGFNCAGWQWIRRDKRGRSDHDFLDTAELLAGFPDDCRRDMLRGAGTFLRFQSLIEARPQLVHDVLQQLWRVEDPAREAVAEGASTPKEYPQVFRRTPKLLGDNLRTLREVHPVLRPSYGRGCGLVCGRLYRREIPAEIELLEGFLSAVPGDVREEVLYGLGWGLADGGAAPAVPRAVAEFVPRAHLGPVLRGYGAGLAYLLGDGRGPYLAALPEDWRAEARAGADALKPSDG